MVKEEDMKKLMVQVRKDMEYCVCTEHIEINVSDDYTMDEVVREIKRRGYTSFRLVDTMKRFAKVN